LSTNFHRWTAIFAAILLLVTSLACGLSGILPQEEGLTVLAGSELKDLEPMLDEIQRATGVRLVMTYTGTLDGAEQILAGEQVDFAWFSHAKYLNLLKGAQGRIQAQEKIMLSPVVLGVKHSLAEEWGWVDNPDLTWQDIVEKAGSGELRYAMTNPSSSNSGFSALVGAAAALSGKTDALEDADIDRISPELKTFIQGQALTAGSSGWLADQYVIEQDHLDGIINYESVLLSLNKSGNLHEPLYLVYPKEGIITADYPLLLINPDQREAYDKVVEYLRSADVQGEIMQQTLRRPVNLQVPLSADFPTGLLVELPFPSQQEVVDHLLFSYLDEQIKPSHTYYVLDVSGSMEGDRLESLKTAMYNLSGADTSLTGQFARFRNREKITIIAFSDQIEAQQSFDVDIDRPDSLDEIRQYVRALETDGNTAIFSALQAAYQEAARDRAQDPERVYSIVLMSDGENNSGISQGEFLSGIRGLPGAEGIRAFTILFGEADQDTMQSIAEATGGRMFDASQASLPLIFKEIRGYQ
jgi:Ca-activated chloride channel family protein